MLDLQEVSERQAARPRPKVQPTPDMDVEVDKHQKVIIDGLDEYQLRSISDMFPEISKSRVGRVTPVTTDSPKDSPTASGSGQSTVRNDRHRVHESEEAHPAIAEPNASISALSEQAVLDAVVEDMSDDATGLLDKEDVVPFVAEDEEPPPSTPEVEEHEPPTRVKRKVCHNPLLRRMFRSINRS